MIVEREFRYEDLKNIVLNDYAQRTLIEGYFLVAFLNDIEIRTLESEERIEALMICGKIRNVENTWYAFCIYAKDCSKMVVRNVRRKLKEKVDKGYHIITGNEEQGLKKFHDFIFKEYL